METTPSSCNVSLFLLFLQLSFVSSFLIVLFSLDFVSFSSSCALIPPYTWRTFLTRSPYMYTRTKEEALFSPFAMRLLLWSWSGDVRDSLVDHQLKNQTRFHHQHGRSFSRRRVYIYYTDTHTSNDTSASFIVVLHDYVALLFRTRLFHEEHRHQQKFPLLNIYLFAFHRHTHTIYIYISFFHLFCFFIVEDFSKR